ncbi:DUF6482 family protein [Vibrio fluvialis]|uniref:DUF6482 family protein n=1 Tax=Vibrio fluvialis TaxID=676 RepID=UPI00192CCC0C|nr:DUF6482 family protein [Vibrio fluvialis]MBL4238007.1 hypothetical protein [Vibrio fluvialis]MBL4265465.1 hypothetical protein [Vibrio fluvialis]MBL4269881.1 hypothetical protein [Vibrio fluvialis]MBL4274552.1 hypothetical protein [Vibrio fluvialis]MBL4296711.1 hypothetical protein [Vibrio fluvialis]
MHKRQLNKWLNATHKPGFVPPKAYVIGCADATHYTLGVEVKHHIEPLLDRGQPLHFSSLNAAKAQLSRLGLTQAYLRMSCAYEECGFAGSQKFSDIPLPLR